ncbi:ribonuclease domain-containing protein [Luedemannella helvata]|uniref:Ribonuclease domain-containing protein n=1 Tax=Luedemannella helvata TaxID=349315 RepID=A0ABP4W0U2_9ACTN
MGGRWWVGAAVAAVALIGIMLFRGGGGPVINGESPSVTMPTTTGTPRSSLPTVEEQELPPEARETIDLIDSGGPYPHREDGTTFRNYERRLPEQGEGYYREFTVGSSEEPGRGPRRIVAGRAGDLYYTEDHYRTFRQVLR